MESYDDPVFGELAKDDRVGDQDLYLMEIRRDTWESGDPRWKFIFSILTAAADEKGGKPKADLTLGPLPSKELIMREKDKWSRGKKQAIANNAAVYKQLAEFYKKSPEPEAPEGLESLKEGDILRGKTDKNRDGFIRVLAFKPPTEGTSATSASFSEVGF